MNPSAEHSDRARLERLLRMISPGDSVDVTINMLHHVTLPTGSDEKRAPDHLIEWFRSRMAFDCTVTPDRQDEPSRWTFYRPLPHGAAGPASDTSTTA
ncbi:hypothetical protein [Rhodopseudomonas sp. RCAM05734]|uniref:hypothetical protein n=1 Tax=Rhodopseudomonas sp. RCAM05734 TaxID=3457549 RepID=UPI0040443537